VLLRSVDFGEADRVVTLLTSRHGKLGLLARGARRSKRRFGGALEPFVVLDVELSFGRGELGSLREAHVTRAFPRILRDLARMSAAGSALELVREAIPERSPDPAIFTSTVRMLEALDQPDTQPGLLSVLFDAHLMSLAGFAPRLLACGVCRKQPARTQAAEFDPARGYIVCRACGGAPHRLSGPLRDLLVQALNEEWSLGAATVCAPEEIAAAQRAMVAFIEHRIERPIARSASRQRPV
jgi:DNA repair protein RecO (recombination protein O)